MNAKPKKTAQDVRNSELAQIHIAQAQLGMDDDTYRNVLWTVARVRSSKDLDWSGRKRVLDHMKACGFKVRSKRLPTAHKPNVVHEAAVAVIGAAIVETHVPRVVQITSLG